MPIIKEVRDWLQRNIKWKADRERECGKGWDRRQLNSPTMRSTRPSTRSRDRQSSDHYSSCRYSNDHDSSECQHYHYNVHNHTEYLNVYLPPSHGRSRSASASRSQVTDNSYLHATHTLDRRPVQTYSMERPRAITVHGGGHSATYSSSSSHRTLIIREHGSHHWYSYYEGDDGRRRDDRLVVSATTHHGVPQGRSAQVGYMREGDWSSSGSEEEDWSRSRRHYRA